MAEDCNPCPVCGRLPRWFPSMIRDAESIGCNWDDHCPDDRPSFDFQTGYLPVDQAISKWNEAVESFNAKQ